MSKKMLFSLLAVVSGFASADPIHIFNKMSYYGDQKQNIIIQLDRGNIKSGGGTSWVTDVPNALADQSYINNDLVYSNNLQPSITGNLYPWVWVGYKLFLADTSGSPTSYLGYFGFTLHGNPNDSLGVISGASYGDSGHDQRYVFTQTPRLNYLSGDTFEIVGTLSPNHKMIPPIITNSGWSSGMGNSDSSFQPGDSFWVQDYGIDEKGRWNVDGQNQAIAQSTQPISGNNVGSRAYPVVKNSQDNYTAGVGGAYDGVWQIDVKVGSNGSGNLCETFYLAERRDFTPGPQNYLDASPAGGDGGYGREIDIMETKWNPSGPQINLPNGGGTSWNPTAYQNVSLGQWTDVGGAPNQSFVTYGAYIKNNNLWIYAYKPDGSLWYSTNAIPLNSSYQQKGPLVPYIGTWGSQAGNFVTEYKNYVYAPVASIPGNINPKDNPSEFYQAVRKNLK